MNSNAVPMSETVATPPFTVRRYRPEDRQAVRDLCCDTGFLGNPIDPVFEDRELFADFLTRPYTDLEPECCFILEVAGRVQGYILGSRRRGSMIFSSLVPNTLSGLKLLWRYPRYQPSSKAYVRWLISSGSRETPAAPKDAAHFHVNIRAEARGFDKVRELFNAFFEHLRACGETRVYGQMSTFESRRTEALFKRFGFTLMNRSEVTKYRNFTSERVFLSTVVKELEPAGADTYVIRSRQHGK